MSVDIAKSFSGLLATMPKRGEDECYRCWYCNSLLGPIHEHDHIFPQSVHGGAGPIAPCCRGCHDLKDRTPLDLWTPEMVFRALAACPIEDHARLLMAKMLSITMNAEMQMDNAMRGVL